MYGHVKWGPVDGFVAIEKRIIVSTLRWQDVRETSYAGGEEENTNGRGERDNPARLFYPSQVDVAR